MSINLISGAYIAEIVDDTDFLLYLIDHVATSLVFAPKGTKIKTVKQIGFYMFKEISAESVLCNFHWNKITIFQKSFL